jgi:hypothetical protein
VAVVRSMPPALVTTAGSSSARGGAGSVLEGCGRGSEETNHTLNTRHFRSPRLSTLVSTCLQENRRQRQQTSWKNHDKEKLKSESHILERTQAFFTGRSDKPSLGAARFEPAGSGAVHFGAAVLGGCSASTRRPKAGPPPHSLGG